MPQRNFIYSKTPTFPRYIGKTGYEETPMGLRDDRSWGQGIRPLRIVQSSIGEIDESPLIIGETRMVRASNNRPYDIQMKDIEITTLPPPRELLSNSALAPPTLFDGTVPAGNPIPAAPVAVPGIANPVLAGTPLDPTVFMQPIVTALAAMGTAIGVPLAEFRTTITDIAKAVNVVDLRKNMGELTTAMNNLGTQIASQDPAAIATALEGVITRLNTVSTKDLRDTQNTLRELVDFFNTQIGPAIDENARQIGQTNASVGVIAGAAAANAGNIGTIAPAVASNTGNINRLTGAVFDLGAMLQQGFISMAERAALPPPQPQYTINYNQVFNQIEQKDDGVRDTALYWMLYNLIEQRLGRALAIPEVKMLEAGAEEALGGNIASVEEIFDQLQLPPPPLQLLIEGPKKLEVAIVNEEVSVSGARSPKRPRIEPNYDLITAMITRSLAENGGNPGNFDIAGFARLLVERANQNNLAIGNMDQPTLFTIIDAIIKGMLGIPQMKAAAEPKADKKDRPPGGGGISLDDIQKSKSKLKKAQNKKPKLAPKQVDLLAATREELVSRQFRPRRRATTNESNQNAVN